MHRRAAATDSTVRLQERDGSPPIRTAADPTASTPALRVADRPQAACPALSTTSSLIVVSRRARDGAPARHGSNAVLLPTCRGRSCRSCRGAGRIPRRDESILDRASARDAQSTARWPLAGRRSSLSGGHRSLVDQRRTGSILVSSARLSWRMAGGRRQGQNSREPETATDGKILSRTTDRRSLPEPW